ncbi:MAG: hypothetical protein IJ748_05320 [Bacteroidales bacterium]|nr:hypothetical protein [Bacteroidales bacterium]
MKRYLSLIVLTLLSVLGFQSCEPTEWEVDSLDANTTTQRENFSPSIDENTGIFRLEDMDRALEISAQTFSKTMKQLGWTGKQNNTSGEYIFYKTLRNKIYEVRYSENYFINFKINFDNSENYFKKFIVINQNINTFASNKGGMYDFSALINSYDNEYTDFDAFIQTYSESGPADIDYVSSSLKYEDRKFKSELYKTNTEKYNCVYSVKISL